MTDQDVITASEPASELPVVSSIRLADLKEVLAKGLQDFWAMPTHVVFLSLIYPIVGIVLGRATLGYDLLPDLYPLAAGFALIGPFAAIGLYELSRRRELGLDTSWQHVFDVVYSKSFASILILGFFLIVLLLIWVAVAHAIYVAYFGYTEIVSVSAFAHQILSTPQGHHLIIVGNAVGLLFALLAFSVSVVAFPLLLDRNVGVAVAVLTSVRAVLRNTIPMIVWGLIVTCLLVLGFLAVFFGLALVMPVLGHSTWHLYRKVIEPDLSPRPQYRPEPDAHAYAADFPAALFPSTKRPRISSEP